MIGGSQLKLPQKPSTSAKVSDERDRGEDGSSESVLSSI